MTNTPQFLRDLPPQFEPLRSFIEANLVPYIKIQVGEEVGSFYGANATGDPLTVWQSKIGGNPYFPKDMEYPIDPGSGKAMPLLVQINCADVPQIAGFDFPKHGILQFYLGYEPADADGVPDRYRVLYFPEIVDDESRLISDFSFIEDYLTIRELYGAIYPIEFISCRDLFWESRTDDINLSEEMTALFQEFCGWISDCDRDNQTGIRGNKLGGYVDFHSNTNEIADCANGRLLLELYHPDCIDDSFLFFMTDDRLGDRDFNEVEFHFVCD